MGAGSPRNPEAEAVELNEITKDALRLSLESHRYCNHETSGLCHALILFETALRRGETIIDDDEIEACGKYVADCVLEGLILKGVMEVTGVDDNGNFFVGLTEEGELAFEEARKQTEEDS